MKDKEENSRNFNGRIFVKGKCYTFEGPIDNNIQSINDKKINSNIVKFFLFIKKIFLKTQPLMNDKYYLPMVFKTFISIVILSLLIIFAYFLLGC